MSTQLSIGDLVRVRHLEQTYTVLSVGLNTVIVIADANSLTVPMRHVELVSAVDRLGQIADDTQPDE